MISVTGEMVLHRVTLHRQGPKRGARTSTTSNNDRNCRARRSFSGRCPPPIAGSAAGLGSAPRFAPAQDDAPEPRRLCRTAPRPPATASGPSRSPDKASSAYPRAPGPPLKVSDGLICQIHAFRAFWPICPKRNTLSRTENLSRFLCWSCSLSVWWTQGGAERHPVKRPIPGLGNPS
jgi:hypothetical protein